MDNKCSLNTHGLGAKHLTDDVVHQPSPLPPPSLYCCIGVTSWFADAPLPCCTGGEQVCSPPSPRCCIGEPLCSCPRPPCCIGGRGTRSPLGAAGAGGGLVMGGRSALQTGSRVSAGRSPGWAPSAAPLLPPLPPQTARLPPSPKRGHGDERGSPGLPSGRGGGGREKQAPPPPPGSKDILFFLPRTKDNEKRGDSGTYPAKSSPLAGNGGPENGALLPSWPCPR